MVGSQEANCLHHHLATQDPDEGSPSPPVDWEKHNEPLTWRGDRQHDQNVSNKADEVDNLEASQITELEKHGQPSASSSAETMGSAGKGCDSDFKVVSFAEGDPEDPDNWSRVSFCRLPKSKSLSDTAKKG